MSITPFLIWLVCVGLSAVLIGYLIKNLDSISLPYTEGFTGIKACPERTNEYIDKQGRTMCCRQEPVNGFCPKVQIACTLSCPGDGIQACEQVASQENTQNATLYCPPSRPNYYNLGREQGCTSARVNPSGVPEAGGKTCRVYSDASDALRNQDSCTLMKQMESSPCPSTTARRSLVSTGEKDRNNKDLPILVACTYSTAKSVIPVTCYTRESAISWALAKYGGEYTAKLAERGLSLSTMINLCPASEQYYVSNTLQKSSATF